MVNVATHIVPDSYGAPIRCVAQFQASAPALLTSVDARFSAQGGRLHRCNVRAKDESVGEEQERQREVGFNIGV